MTKEEKNPWAATYFALIAVVILMIDVFYTTKMIALSEMAYLVIMIGLNILPLGAVAYFNIRYVRMIEGFKTGIVTRVYLGIYNVAFIFLCFVSTLSMVDERTTYDYFANDKAIYAIFWLVFNTLSAVFVWSSCRTVDSNVDCVGNSTDLLLEKAADKFALSTREREIARLLYDGKNNNEIADVLFLSTNTIKVHTSNLYKKIGASNRVQAIKIISGEEI